MDFTWTSCFGSVWIFPLLFLLVMAVMMFACHGMRTRCNHGCAKHSPGTDAAPTPQI